jgi:hypothetical protein
MKIHSTRVTDHHHLNCPNCNKPVFTVYPDQEEVPGGGYWLTDGDTVGGVWDKLTEIQKTGVASDYELMIGHCSECSHDYYVVTLGFSASIDDIAYAMLYDNIAPLSVKNFVSSSKEGCEFPVKEWYTHQCETSVGPTFKHYFGPFHLDSKSSVSGAHGVTMHQSNSKSSPWAHSANIILSFWDDLKYLAQIKTTREADPVVEPKNQPSDQ